MTSAGFAKLCVRNGGRGFVAEAVSTGEDCLKALGRRAYGCILLDVWLPGMMDLKL